MFDFKYQEDIENCYALLECVKIPVEDTSVIAIKPTDDLIDLSPCIGTYQEATFFSRDQYDIDKEIQLYYITHKKGKKVDDAIKLRLDEKILYLTALETKQERYQKQVTIPFVSESERTEIINRLSKVFVPDEEVQVPCEIPFYEENSEQKCFTAIGLCDVLKDKTVYELKFVSELSHVHFLQCACYMVALKMEKGILWNTRDNNRYEVRIADRAAFLDAVAKATTKRQLKKYYHPSVEIER